MMYALGAFKNKSSFISIENLHRIVCGFKPKNMFNRLIALILLIVLSPVFVLVGLAIIIEDGFPVFFLQKRVGVNYSFFHIYKFRSMKKNSPT